MKKVYLITVPNQDGKSAPLVFVTDDISLITGKYPMFMIQQVDFVTDGLS